MWRRRGRRFTSNRLGTIEIDWSWEERGVRFCVSGVAAGVYGGGMKHITNLVVRTYECDANGHVNHAVYVNYLEHARGELLRAGGVDYAGMMRAGYGFVIVRLEIGYHLPAFAGDALEIESEPLETKRASGRIRQVIRRGGEALVEAVVTWCAVDREGRPTRLPAEYDMRRLGG